jgi:hypothetical protein
MRLYRGIKESYRPDIVSDGRTETNFTDCPYAALLYANDRRGEVLIIDVSSDEQSPRKFFEALWVGPKAKRFIVYGKFDQHITGILSAKELRKVVRAKGIFTQPDEYKSWLLGAAIDRAFHRDTARPLREFSQARYLT